MERMDEKARLVIEYGNGRELIEALRPVLAAQATLS